MLAFATLAHDGALAVGVDPLAAAEDSDKAVGQIQREGLQLLHRRLQVRDEAACKGIGADRVNRTPDWGWPNRRPAFVPDLLQLHHDLPDCEISHPHPPSPAHLSPVFHPAATAPRLQSIRAPDRLLPP
jgi:hypothetical protein